MLLMGDELGRTQQGNNNADCQDNEISWLDWNLVEENNDLLKFTKFLLKIYQEHPVLRHLEILPGVGPFVGWKSKTSPFSGMMGRR